MTHALTCRDNKADFQGFLSRNAVLCQSQYSWACRENKEDFEGFLGEEFNSYVDKMEQLGTWGDELTLVSPNMPSVAWNMHLNEM